ncbi:hypothetical protein EJ08DRAFT_277695 [Tothia fuscella]|uniref:Membrane anchor Opy2 N-terminal domain-containing protein n=1 Tax=Tothia fuscella TaxID=1048955 RepID=A0A9P4NQC5_9PEZI|nr:hypothetical protein EJ08DRAFT_277695 [Tothia fuscella]
MATKTLGYEFMPGHSLFKRCVNCPPVAPSCPACKPDEVCNQTLGDCTSCPSATCVKTTNSGSTTTVSSGGGDGPNIGAIVGGVVGGVAIIGIIVFCIWKFWLKGRRHEVEEEWDDPDYPLEKPDNSVFSRNRDARSSTHTVASMASTVLTRASNIIQIAYIPGVTNRTGASSPGLLVPPVPPIPIPTTPSTMNSSHFGGEQHFFVPGDLRDSTYSDMSSINERRPGSIASSLQRNSVATTVYRDSAVLNPMPAQAVSVSKAAVVSVKSGLSNVNSPALTNVSSPQIRSSSISSNRSPGGPVFKMPVSGDSKSGGSGVVQTMKPVALQIVKKGNKSGSSVDIPKSSLNKSITSEQKQPTASQGSGLRPMTQASATSAETADSPGARARRSVTLTLHTGDSDDSDDELEAHERSRRSLLDANRSTKVQSPFTDDAAAPKTPTSPTVPAMLVVKEQKSSPKGKGNVMRGKSPFEDEHAI